MATPGRAVQVAESGYQGIMTGHDYPPADRGRCIAPSRTCDRSDRSRHHLATIEALMGIVASATPRNWP